MNLPMSILLALSLAFAFPAGAAPIVVVQGGIAEMHWKHHAEAPVELHCLGKKWPVEANGTDQWTGWVGVDLDTAVGIHRCQWQAGTFRTDRELQVTAGHFRISRITVDKRMAEFDPETLARIRREVRALKATYGQTVHASPPIAMQQMPVQGVESTPFGARRIVNGEPRSPHSGIDIAAPEGTPVIAPLGGKVLFTASMYLNGNTVVIGHGRGLVSVLSHLADIRVEPGQWVHSGECVGHVGHTGRATGPHLHWSVRFLGARIDPHALF